MSIELLIWLLLGALLGYFAVGHFVNAGRIA